jgi:hypothetical protein
MKNDSTSFAHVYRDHNCNGGPLLTCLWLRRVSASRRRAWWAAGIAAAAVGVLVVALVAASSSSFNDGPVTMKAGSTQNGLAKMKSEVHEKLVAAARRKALARTHRAEAARLAKAVRAEKHEASLFEKQSEVSEEQAELKHADTTVQLARTKVNTFEKQATGLREAADKEKERAAADTAKATEFTDTEQALMQQASEDQDKVKTVMENEKKTAEALPVLMQAAKVDEVRAHKLSVDAKKRLAESKVKAAAALRLDKIVAEKEAQARAARTHLMAVLDKKNKALVSTDAQMRNAERESTQKQALHSAANAKVHDTTRASNLERAGRESERRSNKTEQEGSMSTKLRIEKPARMMMLGDSSPEGSDGMWGATGNTRSAVLLSRGVGESVALEKSPTLEMLWEDPSSLRSVTHDLGSTTRHMEKLAPQQTSGAQELSDRASQRTELYEDGHSSRREDAFRREMSKYRIALKQARAADERRARMATEELAQLPGPKGERVASDQSPRDFEARRGRDWHRQQHQVFGAMLHEPQDGWGAGGRDAYTDMQRRVMSTGRDDQLDEWQAAHGDYEKGEGHRGEGSNEGREWGRQEDGLRRSRIRRLQEELEESRRRDRALEDQTERLQGEMDELREEHGRGEGRAGEGRAGEGRAGEGRAGEGRASEGRGGEGRGGEGRGGEGRGGEGSRRRIDVEGARRRVEERHRRGREHGRDGGRQDRDGASGGSFHPDATYERSYAADPGHVSVAEIKFQHALKGFQRTKSILREGAMVDDEHNRMPALIPAHLPGQGFT